MKQTRLDSFAALLEDAGHALARAVRYGVHAIASMSWPALLLTCAALALALTILPLALLLFIAFMLLKLVVAALVVGARRRRLPSAGHGE